MTKEFKPRITAEVLNESLADLIPELQKYLDEDETAFVELEVVEGYYGDIVGAKLLVDYAPLEYRVKIDNPWKIVGNQLERFGSKRSHSNLKKATITRLFFGGKKQWTAFCELFEKKDRITKQFKTAKEAKDWVDTEWPID